MRIPEPERPERATKGFGLGDIAAIKNENVAEPLRLLFRQILYIKKLDIDEQSLILGDVFMGPLDIGNGPSRPCGARRYRTAVFNLRWRKRNGRRHGK
jgi:hypothetical protein